MVKLKVSGMTCDHCAQTVTKALAAVPAVDRVIEVSVVRSEALLEGSAPAEALIDAVRVAGYEAEITG